jgi:hypothetical protein
MLQLSTAESQVNKCPFGSAYTGLRCRCGPAVGQQTLVTAVGRQLHPTRETGYEAHGAPIVATLQVDATMMYDTAWTPQSQG